MDIKTKYNIDQSVYWSTLEDGQINIHSGKITGIHTRVNEDLEIDIVYDVGLPVLEESELFLSQEEAKCNITSGEYLS